MASESTQTTLRIELQAAQKRIAELERAMVRDAHTAAAAHPGGGVDSDSGERKVLEDAIRRQSEQLAAVIEVEHTLAATLDQELIYARLLQGIQRLFPDVATVLISTYDNERALIRALAGIQDGEIVDVACLPEWQRSS